jgi:signal transduction histidine kinase
LWLGTQRAGLVEVKDPSADRPAFVSHAANTGLASNVIDAITEDASGFLYVGSTNGIDRLDPATGAVKHYGAAEGLSPGLLKAAFRDAEGRLWFGTTSGLVTLLPEPLRGGVAPPIVITGLRLNGQPHPLSAIGEKELHLEPLAPGRHQVELEFVAPRFGGDVMRYQHMLEGADAGWSTPSELRTVTYASLSPGNYRFLARAINSDGVVSELPVVVAFRILHPVWQQAWFLVLSACSFAALIYAVYHHQLRRRLRVANMRTRIATDLHDDIGANLTRIALLSEVARETGNRDTLGSIADIARESVSSMSDIVWAISPRPETAGDLIRRMRQHAEEVFTLRNIALRFRYTGGHEDVKLSMAIRGDVLLVFKEAISNVARHSACTEVAIEFIVGAKDLKLTVADNGRGFDPGTERDGHGLPSMRRRAQRLHGSLEVISSTAAGTLLTLTIPR